MKHFTIPIFVPELACPNRCIYCNQFKITGLKHIPDIDTARDIIEKYLKTIPRNNSEIEIGFFGGNFTGLKIALQKAYLDLAKSYVNNNNGCIQGIRMSTRPDYISKAKLQFLKNYPITTIELGVQSTDKDVLQISERGYDFPIVEKASALIHQFGFKLGLQMMIGLPSDTFEKSMKTAHEIARLGATEARIYPTLVIKETQLETLFRNHHYSPLSLEQAIDWSTELLCFFEQHNVRVIRLGLHPSEELTECQSIVAGPFHPSFRQLVETEIWKKEFQKIQSPDFVRGITLEIAPAQLGNAAGYGGCNRKILTERFKNVRLKGNTDMEGRKFRYTFIQ